MHIPLSRLVRMKAVVVLTANFRLLLPWVETRKQPADEDSRILDRTAVA